MRRSQRQRRRRVLIALAILLLLVIGVVACTRTMMRRPFPQTAGELTLPGLNASVTIHRDEFGIPHIYAENEHDLFMAQGYLHAQDRFWQMEFWRHIGQGRISEITGAAALDSDRFIRTVGWNRIGRETVAFYQAEAPEFMAILQAYSQGVNAYIDQNRNGFSINQRILGVVNDSWEIEPWTPLNTITWGIVMAHDLSGNYNSEIRRMQMNSLIDENTAAALYPAYPHDRPVIVPSNATALSAHAAAAALPHNIDWFAAEQALIGREPAQGFAFGEGDFVGSNNWVIGGQHTNTGLPLLANDPHLGIQMPSIWYEAGLHTPSYDVVGFSFAGVPGIIIGHNGHIAWGVTNLGPDVQDLFVEKINPENPNQYEFQGQWRDMSVIEEVIKVNGDDDVVLQVRQTQHGPVVSDVLDDLDEGLVLSLQWTALRPSRVLQAVVLLNRAQNYTDFKQALSFWDVPGQNFVYGDVEGNIAYQATGLIPVRTNGNGQTPVPGWSGEYEWNGFVPYDQMPTLFNPPQGYIVTANNAVVERNFPFLISVDWDNGNRAQRIVSMVEQELNGDGVITADDIGRMQMDSYQMLAADFVPLMSSLSSSDPAVQAALDELRRWDYQLRRDSVGATLFEIFHIYLLPAVLADELPPEAADIYFRGSDTEMLFLHQLATQTDGRWWDNVTTSAVETREDIMLQALTQTVTWLQDNHGEDMAEWAWGNLHTATFVSDPLGQSGVGALESIVNRGPFPVDGGRDIVNATGWSWDEPAQVTSHPSMRMIVDLSNFDASRTVIPTGQSGHPVHPHYDDMIQLWIEGQYHPMWYTAAAVQNAAVETLNLQP